MVKTCIECQQKWLPKTKKTINKKKFKTRNEVQKICFYILILKLQIISEQSESYLQPASQTNLLHWYSLLRRQE